MNSLLRFRELIFSCHDQLELQSSENRKLAALIILVSTPGILDFWMDVFHHGIYSTLSFFLHLVFLLFLIKTRFAYLKAGGLNRQHHIFVS